MVPPSGDMWKSTMGGKCSARTEYAPEMPLVSARLPPIPSPSLSHYSDGELGTLLFLSQIFTEQALFLTRDRAVDFFFFS